MSYGCLFSDFFVQLNLQEAQFWRLYKENKSLCALVMKTAVGVVYLLACLLEPFIPSFTLEVS